MNTEISTIDHSELSDEEQISRFAGFVHAGINSWINAGRLLVEMKAAQPNIFQKITKRFPAITMDILESFERIGKKEIYPYLLIDDSVGCRALRELPYDKQVQYYGQKIKVVTGLNGNDPIITEKRIQELSANEARGLFYNGEIRSVERQAETLKMFRVIDSPSPAVKSKRKAVEQKSYGCFRVILKKGKIEFQPDDIKVARKVKVGSYIEITD